MTTRPGGPRHRKEGPTTMSKLPDWARRAIRTFGVAFVALFLVSLLGWLGDVQEWASCTVDCRAFPAVTPLGKAAVAAAAAAFIAVLNALQNYLEDHTRFPALLKAPPSPGLNPEPDPSDRGESLLDFVVWIDLALVALFAAIGVFFLFAA